MLKICKNNKIQFLINQSASKQNKPYPECSPDVKVQNRESPLFFSNVEQKTKERVDK